MPVLSICWKLLLRSFVSMAEARFTYSPRCEPTPVFLQRPSDKARYNNAVIRKDD